MGSCAAAAAAVATAGTKHAKPDRAVKAAAKSDKHAAKPGKAAKPDSGATGGAPTSSDGTASTPGGNAPSHGNGNGNGKGNGNGNGKH